MDAIDESDKDSSLTMTAMWESRKHAAKKTWFSQKSVLWKNDKIMRTNLQGRCINAKKGCTNLLDV